MITTIRIFIGSISDRVKILRVATEAIFAETLTNLLVGIFMLVLILKSIFMGLEHPDNKVKLRVVKKDTLRI